MVAIVQHAHSRAVELLDLSQAAELGHDRPNVVDEKSVNIHE